MLHMRALSGEKWLSIVGAIFLIILLSCICNISRLCSGQFLRDMWKDEPKLNDMFCTCFTITHAAIAVIAVLYVGFNVLRLPYSRWQAESHVKNLKETFARCADPQTQINTEGPLQELEELSLGRRYVQAAALWIWFLAVATHGILMGCIAHLGYINYDDSAKEITLAPADAERELLK